MDLKTFAESASIVVCMVAMSSVGCDAHSASSRNNAPSASLPVLAEPHADAPRSRRAETISRVLPTVAQPKQANTPGPLCDFQDGLNRRESQPLRAVTFIEGTDEVLAEGADITIVGEAKKPLGRGSNVQSPVPQRAGESQIRFSPAGASPSLRSSIPVSLGSDGSDTGNEIVFSTRVDKPQGVAVKPEVLVPQPEPRVAKLKPRVAKPEPRVAKPEPRVAKAKPPIAQPEPRVAKQDLRVAKAEPAVTKPEPRVAEPEPRLAEAEPRVNESGPRLAEAESRVVQPGPRAAEPQVRATETETCGTESELAGSLASQKPNPAVNASDGHDAKPTSETSSSADKTANVENPGQQNARASVPQRESLRHDALSHEPADVVVTKPILQDHVAAADSRRRHPSKVPAASLAPDAIGVIGDPGQRVRQGFQLAEVGAVYLARVEFIAALKLIAQSSDAKQGTRQYSKALVAGLVALKESSDFIVHNSGIEDADVVLIVSKHKTVVLKNDEASHLAPMAAAQRYFIYAKEQLGIAAGREMNGSMALYGLAKVAIASRGVKSQQPEYAGEAMVLYQAALVTSPNNFRAANDLAVLLAKNGQLGPARDLLQHSISLSPHSATWKNLASVYLQMGDPKSADHAQAQAVANQRLGGAADPAVQWVDPATFARTAPATGDLIPATAAAHVDPVSAKPPVADSKQPTTSVAKKGLNDWLPVKLRR